MVIMCLLIFSLIIQGNQTVFNRHALSDMVHKVYIVKGIKPAELAQPVRILVNEIKYPLLGRLLLRFRVVAHRTRVPYKVIVPYAALIQAHLSSRWNVDAVILGEVLHDPIILIEPCGLIYDQSLNIRSSLTDHGQHVQTLWQFTYFHADLCSLLFHIAIDFFPILVYQLDL